MPGVAPPFFILEIFMYLLSDANSNTKLAKSSHQAKGAGFRIWDLSLRPATGSGYNVCEYSTPTCRALCCVDAVGHGNRKSVQDARDRKTRRLFRDRLGFLEDLHADLSKAVTLAARDGEEPIVRLNVGSDQPWEDIDPRIFDHPATFYDYSKVRTRFAKTLPDNYFLTYSHNEKTPHGFSESLLRRGVNVAVVFDTLYLPRFNRIGNLPKTWRRHKIVDGDKHDLRLPRFDGRGNVVGLRAKGGHDAIIEGVAKGFIVRTRNGVISSLIGNRKVQSSKGRA